MNRTPTLCTVYAGCNNKATHLYTNDLNMFLARACDWHHNIIQAIPLEVAQLAVKTAQEGSHDLALA